LALPRSIRKVELLSVPQSSISYLLNIGTGISSTQLHNHPENFRTIKLIFFQSPCLVFDGGRRGRAAKRSKATVLTRCWHYLDSNMTTTA
jgi:hypothetical protein